MSLIELPAEILLQIFDHVGSSYFRSDLSHLRVCKRWNGLAHIVCFREACITTKMLRRMASSPYAESSLREMEILDLNLEGFGTVRPGTVLDPKDSSWNYAPDQSSLQRRTMELNDDLVHLATIIKQSRKLRTLRIKAIKPSNPVFEIRETYLFPSTLRALLLSTSNLTALELDLYGTRPEPEGHPHHGDDGHVCPMIGALLPTLQRLRLRVRTICADALRPPRDFPGPLPLRVLLVDFVLTEELANEKSRFTARCGGPGRFVRLAQVVRGAVLNRARALLPHTSAPKMVRILTGTFSGDEIQGIDVLTGKNIKVKKGAEWDDDSEVMMD
ncbi:Putative protein of unknown function [Podospora comata]|uniref:F-box domain-containing protein n=1 Tax=Podospora comata TaxID=48703 RepID=A0ABY6S9I4_PODCO|nr:Putative protein of unknown function [Podospora comata]